MKILSTIPNPPSNKKNSKYDDYLNQMRSIKINFYTNMFYIKAYCLKASDNVDDFYKLYNQTPIKNLGSFVIKKILDTLNG